MPNDSTSLRHTLERLINDCSQIEDENFIAVVRCLVTMMVALVGGTLAWAVFGVSSRAPRADRP
jgi:hypothetical protein